MSPRSLSPFLDDMNPTNELLLFLGFCGSRWSAFCVFLLFLVLAVRFIKLRLGLFWASLAFLKSTSFCNALILGIKYCLLVGPASLIHSKLPPPSTAMRCSWSTAAALPSATKWNRALVFRRQSRRKFSRPSRGFPFSSGGLNGCVSPSHSV